MREGVCPKLCLSLLNVLIFFLCFNKLHCSPLNYLEASVQVDNKDALLPEISPTATPQPFLPFLAPSPLTPFTNNTVPKLSGLCMLNFTAAESMMSVTSTDCIAVFAPFLANVVCCPQIEATLLILIGQSSKSSNLLALNGSHSKNCLSDVDKILVGQGASENLQKICSLKPSNLTEGSCPVKSVDEFEKAVNSSQLISACENIDLVNECCDQICQNAISDAATKIASKAYDYLSISGSNLLADHSTMIDDCKNIVLRWLASKLTPLSAKEVLRGLSNCKVNKVCPLVFPDLRYVVKSCGDGISNQIACCTEMENYVTELQKQSFITNLQALDCAALLGMKLRKANIRKNVYDLCRISLKDFSLQVGTQESGCLLPSLPSDATYDQYTGISFHCDLNDNIPAPWPSKSQLPVSSCNKTVKIPALPAAASCQRGLYSKDVMFLALSASSVVLTYLL